MAGRNFLFVPGPTNVPDRVLRAMAVAMEDHRSPIFPELTRACLNALKPVFKTTSASERSTPVDPNRATAWAVCNGFPESVRAHSRQARIPSVWPLRVQLSR